MIGVLEIVQVAHKTAKPVLQLFSVHRVKIVSILKRMELVLRNAMLQMKLGMIQLKSVIPSITFSSH